MLKACVPYTTYAALLQKQVPVEISALTEKNLVEMIFLKIDLYPAHLTV